MADCANCGAPVHAEAIGCPHCGADPRTGVVSDAVRRLETQPRQAEQRDKGRRGLADATPRPRAVSAALLLLIASSVVWLPLGTWRALVSPPIVNGQRPIWWASLSVVIFLLAMSAGLIAALAYRRRWAYVVYLVSAVLALPSVRTGINRSFDLGPGRAAEYVIGLSVWVATIVLLLQPAARKWYGFGPKTAGGVGEWRPDPSGRHQHRYWDGTAWTDQVADDGQVGVDPPGDLPAEAPPAGA